jgi:hypothetical protein
MPAAPGGQAMLVKCLRCGTVAQEDEPCRCGAVEVWDESCEAADEAMVIVLFPFVAMPDWGDEERLIIGG